MFHRLLAATIVLLTILFGATRGRTQANETAQAAATGALPATVQKILTKDLEYMRLLSPPAGNDFLQTYSKGYREKSEEIEARIADISDENLRGRARSDEWSRVLKKDRDTFRTEAEVTFNEAKILFLQNHRDALFEVGHAAYDETNHSLAVQTSPAAPVEASFRVVMNSATINQVYDRFRQIAGPEIDRKAREYVSKAGVGSNCSRNPDWCYAYAKEDIERNLRSARLVVVARGDMQARRIDRLFLADYDTETEILELDPHIPTFATAGWRFSVGLVPPVPTELQSSDAPAQPAAATPAEPAPSSGQSMEGARSGNIGAPRSNPSASSSIPPKRLSVPSTVTAASIVTQTKPQYPAQARARRVQGDVILHAIIDKEGKISELQVLSGDDLLAQAALEAVRQWRYKPMLFDGEPAEVDTNITVTFSLND
jgi:TonB family protein